MKNERTPKSYQLEKWQQLHSQLIQTAYHYNKNMGWADVIIIGGT